MPYEDLKKTKIVLAAASAIQTHFEQAARRHPRRANYFNMLAATMQGIDNMFEQDKPVSPVMQKNVADILRGLRAHAQTDAIVAQELDTAKKIYAAAVRVVNRRS